VIASGLPDPTSVSSGTAYLTTTLSGAFPSGLYVRAVDGWFHIL
jgi:hypothetical protein